MTANMIRAAEPPDAVAIAAIYNQGIEERNATFETRLRTAADFADAEPPFLVAMGDGEVKGWARLAPFNPPDCYAGVGVASSYVDRQARGQGPRRAAFDAPTTAAERAGGGKLIGGVSPENEASVALCRAAGCREVGVFRRHSRLDGEWRDVLYVEKLIGPAAQD